MPFHKQTHCSLGFISVIRSLFIQSGSVHPLPAVAVLAGRPSPALRVILSRALLMQACHIFPLHCASIMPFRAFYCPPQALALAGRLPFVRSSLIPAPFDGSHVKTAFSGKEHFVYRLKTNGK